MTKYNYNLSEAPNYMATSKYDKRKLSAEEIAIIKWALAYYTPPDNLTNIVHHDLLKTFSHKDFFIFLFTAKSTTKRSSKSAAAKPSTDTSQNKLFPNV